ncbi:hypothetical protein [Maribacter arenosus]|uniref:PH domain-containing protein n=1 Tax=Maribacter arenosus TaxID=1854708 RepID=A0ABR7VG58_9FLAO|nr:hypothetical protein [Maribacter arenosus]MBD0852640.1 hypothetical protein [Maribacter arenosus]
MTNIINNKTSRFFPDVFAYIGYLMIFIGVVLLIKEQRWGIVLIILGILLGFSFVGILIDTDKRTFKTYSSLFGFKKGVWESYDDYVDLSILEVNQKQKGHSRTGLEFSSKFMVYRVFMLDKKHRKRILLQEFKTKELAVEFAEVMSKSISKPIKTYSPVISKSSRSKR